MKTPLQQLTTLIQASNPELLTLGVGQKFNSKYYGIITATIITNHGNGIYSIYGFDEKEGLPRDSYYPRDLELIGKPPTLVDVLKWAKLPFETAEETYFSYGLIRERILELWNLDSIYLRDQSPELINFLININNG